MPELPDLVHIRERLSDELVGQTILTARFGDPVVLRLMVPGTPEAFLEDAVFGAVQRRGHFLRFELSKKRLIVVNAMLVGRYTIGEPLPPKRVPVSVGMALRLGDGRELRYLDEKRMGKIYLSARDQEAQIPVYSQLGVDISGKAFTPALFAKLLARRRDQVRNFLMDKSALASIGNCYADEILYDARIHPKTFCNKLLEEERTRLYGSIRTVLDNATAEIRRRAPPLEKKLRDFVQVRGRQGQPCNACGDTIRSVRVGSSDACFCPNCQPASRALFIAWGSKTRRHED